MATVVSVTAITNRFTTLGWDNLAVPEVIDFLIANSIPASSLIAYLDAAILTPGGFNDQSINGCTAPNATKITAALKAKGVEAI